MKEKEYTICHLFIEEISETNLNLYFDVLAKIASTTNNCILRLNEVIKRKYISLTKRDKFNIISIWWIQLQNNSITKLFYENTQPPKEDLESFNNDIKVYFLHVACKSRDRKNILIIREQNDYKDLTELIRKYNVTIIDKNSILRDFEC